MDDAGLPREMPASRGKHRSGRACSDSTDNSRRAAIPNSNSGLVASHSHRSHRDGRRVSLGSSARTRHPPQWSARSGGTAPPTESGHPMGQPIQGRRPVRERALAREDPPFPQMRHAMPAAAGREVERTALMSELSNTGGNRPRTVRVTYVIAGRPAPNRRHERAGISGAGPAAAVQLAARVASSAAAAACSTISSATTSSAAARPRPAPRRGAAPTRGRPGSAASRSSPAGARRRGRQPAAPSA